MSRQPFPQLPPEQLAALQARFVELRPQIEKHGRIYFRFVRCKQRLADLIAEMVALGWKYFVRLVLRGKDPRRFLAMFNRRLAQHVKLGRRITGKEKPNDVLSPRAQVQHGFMVQTLPQYETDSGENEALYTLCKTISTRRPPDQAAFRIDIPAWVRSHTERTRNVICALIVGERTKAMPNRHGHVIVVEAESACAWSPPRKDRTVCSTGMSKQPHGIGCHTEWHHPSDPDPGWQTHEFGESV